MNKKGANLGGVSALIGVVVTILILGIITSMSAKVTNDISPTLGANTIAQNVTNQTTASFGVIGSNMNLIVTIAVVAVIITLLLGAFAFGKSR